MVLILDGSSEHGAHLSSKFCYLICLLHWNRSRAFTNWIFFYPKRHIFLQACATCIELTSNISIMYWILLSNKDFGSASSLVLESGSGSCKCLICFQTFPDLILSVKTYLPIFLDIWYIYCVNRVKNWRTYYRERNKPPRLYNCTNQKVKF